MRKKKTLSKQRFISIKRIIFWLSLIVFLSIGFWAIIFSPLMAVNFVSLEGEHINKEQVQAMVWRLMEGKYWKIFPRNNLLLIPQKEIEKMIVDQFRVAKGVSIKKIFPQGVKITVEERASMLVWCVKSACFLVDESGEVFYQLKQEEVSDGNLTVVLDGSDNQLEVGRKIVEKEMINFYQNLSRLINNQLQIEMTNQLYTPSCMSGEVRAKTVKGWEVFFNINEPIEKQLTVLKKVYQGKISSEDLYRLEYIDLRLKGRVSFKLKSTEEEKENEESREREEEKTEEEKK